MNVTYNADRTAVAIIGEYSPHPVYATSAVVEALGGAESAYHTIKTLAAAYLLPRRGSPSRPLTMTDLRYWRENEARQERYWQWFDMSGPVVLRDTGYRFVRGYGYKTATQIVIVDANDTPLFRITRIPNSPLLPLDK